MLHTRLSLVSSNNSRPLLSVLFFSALQFQ